MNAANVDRGMSAEDIGICIAVRTLTFSFWILKKQLSVYKIQNV